MHMIDSADLYTEMIGIHYEREVEAGQITPAVISSLYNNTRLITEHRVRHKATFITARAFTKAEWRW